MAIIDFKKYSDDNFCKRILIRAKQLAFAELDEYREIIIMPEKEFKDTVKGAKR